MFELKQIHYVFEFIYFIVLRFINRKHFINVFLMVQIKIDVL